MEAKGKVLVIDDEQCVRDLVSRKLTVDGYVCDLAGDAETALSRLTQVSYDCLLSDVNLPGMNGVEFLRRVRLTDQDVAVIMITGSPDIDCALEAMRLGAYDHLRQTPQSRQADADGRPSGREAQARPSEPRVPAEPGVDGARSDEAAERRQ